MKAETIYNITMALIDEYKENGQVDYNATKDYKARTPSILTVLSTNVAQTIRKVDKNYDIPSQIKELSDDVELEDDVCQGIIPEGLAGYLLATEDSSLANFFISSFSEKLNNYLISQYRNVANISERIDEYNSSLS